MYMNLKIFRNIKIILIVIIAMIFGAVGYHYYTIHKYVSRAEIDLLTPYQGYGACHPKVVYFPEGFNGYKYWMAYTPYPKHNARFENPVIAVSNDLDHWKSHPESKNTILDDGSYERNPRIYNSDTHIFYNSDTHKLECWWRHVDEPANKITIYRRTSDNGVKWTEKEVVYESQGKDKVDWLSPAIIYENGLYRIWYVNKADVWYTESTDLKSYKKPVKMNINYGDNIKPWHLDVEKTSNGYDMIFVGYKDGAKNHFHMNLYNTTSLDGLNDWSDSKVILTERKGAKYWDNAGIYRSALLQVGDTFHVIYTGWDDQENVGIGHVKGKSLSTLK